MYVWLNKLDLIWLDMFAFQLIFQLTNGGIVLSKKTSEACIYVYHVETEIIWLEG